MFGNIPRSIEYAVQWVSDTIEWAYDNKISYIEATDKGMDDWTQHVHECGKGLLANEVDSWMTGVVSDVAVHSVGCSKRIVEDELADPPYRTKTWPANRSEV